MGVEMSFSNRKKAVAINAFLVAVLFGLVSLNKEFLRPNLSGPDFLKTLTGCFPNFIAAYIISLCSVTAVMLRKIKHGRMVVYVSSLIVFIILTVEEFKPMWGASSTYDISDIVASGVGAIFTIITYELLVYFLKRRELKKRNI